MCSVFPSIEKYIKDFLLSILEQTEKNFDILILNDNLGSQDLLNKFPNNTIIDIPNGTTPSKIRLIGINYAIEKKYKRLIFSDADDYFSNNRVEKTITALNKFDFTYNQIIAVDEKGAKIKNISPFPSKKFLKSYKDIIDYNIIGLSNSAINLNVLKNFYITTNVEIVDWWLYTILLINGASGTYIEDTITFYRQTDDNFEGYRKILYEENLIFGLSTKITHYSNILKYCEKYDFKLISKDYIAKKNEIVNLQKKLKSKVFQKKYLEFINKNMTKIYKGWWSTIINLDEYYKYEKN